MYITLHYIVQKWSAVHHRSILECSGTVFDLTAWGQGPFPQMSLQTISNLYFFQFCIAQKGWAELFF